MAQNQRGIFKMLQELAPQVGLEPTTLRLTAGCSAIELLRSVGADTEKKERRSSYCHNNIIHGVQVKTCPAELARFTFF